MDIRKIKKLIELLEESALTEIEISEGEESIRLSRSSPLDPAESTTAIPPPARLTETPAPSPESSSTGGDLPSAIPGVSPMVGTFYAAPNPESSPYIKTGSEVAVGDTLCVIEAMKTFNHVEAECAGVIRKILKNSGDPVEFGETLFLIETPTEESAT